MGPIVNAFALWEVGCLIKEMGAPDKSHEAFV